jgi:DNA polymerase III sliding clamp (beta) subunit (PCNA family)
VIEILKFVQGAVSSSKKGFVPALSHFRIKGGWITGFNGTMAIGSPIPLGMDACPNAEQFVTAIEACKDTVAITMTANGKLFIHAGGFQTHVDCLPPAEYPPLPSGGTVYPITDNLIPALTYLEGFIAEDASRPWACGILFDGTSAYATNNIVLQQFWLGYNFPCRVNIPAVAVKELLRIGTSPKEIRVSNTSITFGYGDGRWLRAQLLESKWPDLRQLFELHTTGTEPFPAGFFDACKQIEPFTDAMGGVYMLGKGVATTPDPSVGGTFVTCRGVPTEGRYNVRQLLKLENIAEEIAFQSFPAPVYFKGNGVRGIIVGLRG